MAEILSAFSTLGLLATTGPNGVALQNASPSFLSWTAPNDGRLHRVSIFAMLNVTVAQTGGQIVGPVSTPFANTPFIILFGGSLGVGTYIPANGASIMVFAGQTVQVGQGNAQTLGAATLYAEIWGS